MADLALISAEGKFAPDPARIRELSRDLGEAPAALMRRQAAAAVYRDQALPERWRHLWRYTDPETLLPRRPLPAAAAPAEAPGWPAAGPAVLLVPGAAPVVNEAATRAGVRLAPLGADPADLELLGTAVPARHGFLEALNAAAWTAGLVVRIPRNLRLAAPLRVIVAAAGPTTLPRLLIHAGAMCEATIVEEHVGGEDEARVASVTELFAAAGAQVQHLVVQRWDGGVHGHLTVRSLLDRDAGLLTAVASLGGATAKLDLGAVLRERGARSELYGVTLGAGDQHLDHHTEHRHLAGHTWSNLDFKVALTDAARSAYTGLIRIEEGAPFSEAYQENRNLLLAERARAETIPELEILTDEVACSHGATVSPVDREQLFYLRSRGLGADESLRLVVRGFLEETLRRLPEGTRAALEERIRARLTGLEAIR